MTLDYEEFQIAETYTAVILEGPPRWCSIVVADASALPSQMQAQINIPTGFRENEIRFDEIIFYIYDDNSM